MDFKNKYLVITLRSLLGLALVASGILGLFMGSPPAEMLTAPAAAAFAGMEALGVLKVIALMELVSGLMLLSGQMPALGAILAAPIIVVMVVYHIAREPATIVPSLVLALLNAYMGYVYWPKYKPLFHK
jgi:putative oxidoreductase